MNTRFLATKYGGRRLLSAFSILILLTMISMSPAYAGTLFVGADVEDFGFPEGTINCPGGALCDKIGKADVTGAVHNSTTIIDTDYLINGMADAGGVLLTGTPRANALNTVDFNGNLISTIAAPGIPNSGCCNEEMLFVPQGAGADKVYHAHYPDVIREIDPVTGVQLAIFTQIEVVGMALVNGEIWISRWDSRQIGIWDPAGNTFTLMIQNAALTALGNTGALAFDPPNQILWVGSQGGQVTPFDLAGNQLGASFLPFGSIPETIDGLTFLGEVTGLTRFDKELTSGPDADGDGAIDLVIEVGQLTSTAYDFTINYNDPENPNVLIVDTVPAEWIVVEIEDQDVDVDECGESDTADGAHGMVDVFKNGKLGKNCKSATEIEWMPSLLHALYGAAGSGSAPSTLYTIDPTTGAASPVGPIGFNGVGGLDAASDGTLFGIGRRPGDGVSVLLTIDTSSGAGTEVGPTNTLGVDLRFDLSFRNGDGQLFGTGFAALPPLGCVALATVDTTTGVTADLGSSTTCNPGNGLAYTPADVLYQADITGGGTLYTLNDVTGVATPVAALSYVGFPGIPRINAMEFDTNSGAILVSANIGGGGSGPNFLATLDVASGVITNIGQTVNGLDALAFAGTAGVSDLRVDATTRVSPGKGHRTPIFAPTSCGALYLNDGAIALLKDENGDLVLDPPITGDPIVVAGPTNSICLAAVEDLNGGGLIRDGSGDEDGDNLTDLEEACDIGTDPCLADTDGDGINDDLDECPLEGPPGAGEVQYPNGCNRDFVLFSVANNCDDILEAGVVTDRELVTDSSRTPPPYCDFSYAITNGDFSCASCDTADFSDASTQIGRGVSFCGYSSGVPIQMVLNNDQICARSGLTGAKWDIDFLTHSSFRTGCVDNDGGVSCANAACPGDGPSGSPNEGVCSSYARRLFTP